MADALPIPFVTPEADLTGYDFMPLFGEQLRSSDFNGHCTDAEFRAALNLWWGAWKQIPAASVPDDDVVLCRLADLGRDLKAWRKVKAVAMANFVLCSDGRWYHTFLAPEAVKAWDARKKQRAKGALGNEKRWGKRVAVGIAQAIAQGSPEDSHKDRKGQGQLSNNTFETGKTDAPPVDNPQPRRIDSTSTPRAAAHSLANTERIKAEAAIAKANAVPPPEGLIKRKPTGQDEADARERIA